MTHPSHHGTRFTRDKFTVTVEYLIRFCVLITSTNCPHRTIRRMVSARPSAHSHADGDAIGCAPPPVTTVRELVPWYSAPKLAVTAMQRAAFRHCLCAVVIRSSQRQTLFGSRLPSGCQTRAAAEQTCAQSRGPNCVSGLRLSQRWNPRWRDRSRSVRALVCRSAP